MNGPFPKALAGGLPVPPYREGQVLFFVFIFCVKNKSRSLTHLLRNGVVGTEVCCFCRSYVVEQTQWPRVHPKCSLQPLTLFSFCVLPFIQLKDGFYD